MTDIANLRIRDRAQVCQTLGVSASTLDRMVKSGRFPSPIRIGVRRIGWRETDVAAWVAGATFS